MVLYIKVFRVGWDGGGGSSQFEHQMCGVGYDEFSAALEQAVFKYSMYVSVLVKHSLYVLQILNAPLSLTQNMYIVIHHSVRVTVMNGSTTFTLCLAGEGNIALW